MRLNVLTCGGTPVADLGPLKGLPLTSLNCYSTPVVDLAPLKNIKLKSLFCDFRYDRDAEVLRSIKTLEGINNKPAQKFWQEAEAHQAAFEMWRKNVAGLRADKQVEAVVKKLKEMNPGFDGKVAPPRIENGVVRHFQFGTDQVTDLSPVRALQGLKSLGCQGSGPGAGKLIDLSPLRGMRLTALSLYHNPVADLWPLRGLPLTYLNCSHTRVADLAPLKNMKLTGLCCHYSPVADLAPLRGMSLTSVYCQGTKVADLAVLKGMPLQELMCDFKPERDAKLLRSIKTLEKINDKPAKEVWKAVDAQPPRKKP
jgi:hypothetical protein